MCRHSDQQLMQSRAYSVLQASGSNGFGPCVDEGGQVSMPCALGALGSSQGSCHTRNDQHCCKGGAHCALKGPQAPTGLVPVGMKEAGSACRAPWE